MVAETISSKRSKQQDLDALVRDVVFARKRQKLTQQQLAMMAGLSRRTIVLIESGGDCTLSTLQRIATALGLEIRARSQALPTLEDVTRENEELFANQRSLQNN